MRGITFKAERTRPASLASGSEDLSQAVCSTVSGSDPDGVVPNFKQTTMVDFVTHHVTRGSTVYTDGLKGFESLQAAGVTHVRRTQPLKSDLRKGAASVVPLADRAIGNLQQWLIGTYHGVSKAQLQVYLDEFVFRHNRRRQPMAAFQTLLGLGTGRAPTPGAQDMKIRLG
jgi:transposase-like protein